MKNETIIIIAIAALLLLSTPAMAAEINNDNMIPADPQTLQKYRQLSANFSLDEMLRSSTADSHQVTEQYTPPLNVLQNLQALAINVLQPLRNAYGKPLHISSGYRCPRVNTLIGGKPTSQHLKGQAADIDLGSVALNKALYQKILAMGLVFDQLINEHNYEWVHISYNPGNNRHQILTIE